MRPRTQAALAAVSRRLLQRAFPLGGLVSGIGADAPGSAVCKFEGGSTSASEAHLRPCRMNDGFTPASPGGVHEPHRGLRGRAIGLLECVRALDACDQ